VALVGATAAGVRASEGPTGLVPTASVRVAVNDGAVADPVYPAYRPSGTVMGTGVGARILLASEGTRLPVAIRAAAAAQARALAVAQARARVQAKARAQRAKAAAVAAAVARARAAAAKARSLARRTPVVHAPTPPAATAPSPAPTPYQGDPTRSPGATSSSAVRASIPIAVWRASATARRVVRLESGGDCQEVSASGKYRGCWQMTQGLWQGHGGRAFAPRPELATCAQQDIVAYRIWVEQGWSPWTTA
jgi:hypothetical protein